MAGPESIILKACLELLSHLGITAWRSNSGGVSGTYTSKRTGKTRKRFIKFAGIEGLSDITGILSHIRDGDGNTHRGVFLAIETKAPGNCPTDKQLAYLQLINRMGGVALCVHSTDELLTDLRECGYDLPHTEHR